MRTDWPATPHLQSLVDSVPTDKDLVVSFVTEDGQERAVWDNGRYYESFRWMGCSVSHQHLGIARTACASCWVPDTIEEAARWPVGMDELYGQACLYLGELGEAGKPLSLEPAAVCMGCSSDLRAGRCPNIACRWAQPNLEISYDSDNYMSFSLRPKEDATPEQLKEFEGLEQLEAQRYADAHTPEEMVVAEDLAVLGVTLDWGATALEMAANMRRASRWLETVSERFPYCEIIADID